MSGLGKALPHSTWLKWLQDVFNPHKEEFGHHREVSEELFKAHDKKLAEHETSLRDVSDDVAALAEAQEDLERRVAALEGKPEPEPEPGPQPDPDPDPDPEPEPGPDPKPYLPPVLASTTLEGVAPDDPTLRTDPPTGPVTKGNWYVNGNLPRSGDGRSPESAFRTLEEGLAALTDGQRLIVFEATYKPRRMLNRAQAWNKGVEIFAYGRDRPLIDASGFEDTTPIMRFTGASRREHWKGFEFINGPARGIELEGRYLNIEDTWVHHCMMEPFYAADFGSGASDILFLDSFGWACGDGRSVGTNVPDVFVATSNKTRNIYRVRAVRCGGANGADDIFDWFQCRDGSIESCGGVGGGRYFNGNRGGDGSGFKLGGGTDSGRNGLYGSIAYSCSGTGVNHNLAPLPNVYDGNTSVGCSEGFIVDHHSGNEATNNLAWRNSRYDNSSGPQSESHNSWNSPRITEPRFANPSEGDFSLAPGSPALTASAEGGPIGGNESAAKIVKWLVNHPDVYAA